MAISVVLAVDPVGDELVDKIVERVNALTIGPGDDPAAQMGPLVTPEIAGAALVELVQAEAATLAPGYLLTGAGLQPLP